MNIAATMDNWRISDEDAENWLSDIETASEGVGAYFRISPDHAAIFCTGQGPASDSLLVSFESMDQACHRPHRMPVGLDICARNDPSRLIVLAKGRTWFRDEALTAFFSRLKGEGFFDDFERHVFYGAAMGGYGAACFSRYTPGSVVILTEPVATLDPRTTPWEQRFPDQRRRNFSGTGAFAPDCAASAASCIVLHRNNRAEDIMHASLFSAENQRRFVLRFLRQNAEEHLMDCGALKHIISSALRISQNDETPGNLRNRIETECLTALRLRRSSVPYLRYLFARLNRSGRTGLLLRLCKHGETVNAAKAFFQRKQHKLEIADEHSKQST